LCDYDLCGDCARLQILFGENLNGLHEGDQESQKANPSEGKRLRLSERQFHSVGANDGDDVESAQAVEMRELQMRPRSQIRPCNKRRHHQLVAGSPWRLNAAELAAKLDEESTRQCQVTFDPQLIFLLAYCRNFRLAMVVRESCFNWRALLHARHNIWSRWPSLREERRERDG